MKKLLLTAMMALVLVNVAGQAQAETSISTIDSFSRTIGGIIGPWGCK